MRIRLQLLIFCQVSLQLILRNFQNFRLEPRGSFADTRQDRQGLVVQVLIQTVRCILIILQMGVNIDPFQLLIDLEDFLNPFQQCVTARAYGALQSPHERHCTC
ncbi:hypothetical protein SDC9_127337 [bioreactor metagenome]|uniref:Uncharacterized protein n=1 Tax=bioreactor metagenome TaxID=1076179 RepID=A0A645CT65_9ZZZZ